MYKVVIMFFSGLILMLTGADLHAGEMMSPSRHSVALDVVKSLRRNQTAAYLALLDASRSRIERSIQRLERPNEMRRWAGRDDYRGMEESGSTQRMRAEIAIILRKLDYQKTIIADALRKCRALGNWSHAKLIRFDGANPAELIISEKYLPYPPYYGNNWFSATDLRIQVLIDEKRLTVRLPVLADRYGSVLPMGIPECNYIISKSENTKPARSHL